MASITHEYDAHMKRGGRRGASGTECNMPMLHEHGMKIDNDIGTALCWQYVHFIVVSVCTQ